MSQFALLAQRRFAPLFCTQFLGAFNDTFYKSALAILALRAGAPEERDLFTNLAQGLLVLPFFLFSATAGQLADKYDKARIVRAVKLVEIAIMAVGVLGFVGQNRTLLLGVVFALGTHSTVFGPVKYSILPQHLREDELVAGNGLVEMGTFVAILLGTMLGGILMPIEPYGPHIVAATCVVVAIAGYAAGRFVPSAPSAQPDLGVGLNLFRETWRTIQYSREVDSVFKSVLGISWLWFYGALFLAQLPGYAQDSLGGTEGVVTLLLATFSIGIGVGSMLCERMSGSKIEIGLVPFGAFGMTAFALDLGLASPSVAPAVKMGVAELLATGFGWRALADLALIGMFGGFYSVPLYAFIQHRSRPEVRSRIIAALNVISAGFMVVAAGLAIGLRKVGFTIPQLFVVTAALNAIVAVYIFSLVPEFLARFLVWLLVHTVYRLRVEGVERIPDDGPALLVSNHVARYDGMLIAAACRRPIRFVLHRSYFDSLVLRFVFKTAKAIPIARRQEDPELRDRAFEEVAAALAAGDLVCIFPEGTVSRDGELGEFRPGIEKVLARTPVPVIPLALRGVWGRRGLFAPVALVCGEPVAADAASAPELRSRVAALLHG